MWKFKHEIITYRNWKLFFLKRSLSLTSPGVKSSLNWGVSIFWMIGTMGSEIIFGTITSLPVIFRIGINKYLKQCSFINTKSHCTRILIGWFWKRIVWKSEYVKCTDSIGVFSIFYEIRKNKRNFGNLRNKQNLVWSIIYLRKVTRDSDVIYMLRYPITQISLISFIT